VLRPRNDHTEPGAQRPGRGELGGDARGVLGLDLVVVGEHDPVLGREVVVGGAQGNAGGLGDVAHRGGVEAVAPEERQGGVADAVAGGFAFGGECFEHVQ
jgi:hypothetical protein